MDKTNSPPAPPLWDDVVLDVGAFSVVEFISAGALVCSIRVIGAAFRDAACAALGSNAILARKTQITK